MSLIEASSIEPLVTGPVAQQAESVEAKVEPPVAVLPEATPSITETAAETETKAATSQICSNPLKVQSEAENLQQQITYQQGKFDMLTTMMNQILENLSGRQSSPEINQRITQIDTNVSELLRLFSSTMTAAVRPSTHGGRASSSVITQNGVTAPNQHLVRQSHDSLVNQTPASSSSISNEIPSKRRNHAAQALRQSEFYSENSDGLQLDEKQTFTAKLKIILDNLPQLLLILILLIIYSVEMSNSKAYLNALLLVIIGLVLLRYYLNSSNDNSKFVLKAPYLTKSAPLSKLNKLLRQRFEFVKKNSTPLDPYSHDQFEVVKTAVLANAQNGDLPATVLPSMLLLPNGSLGTVPLAPLKNDPLKQVTFQFGQGSAGWYFLYGTFVQPSENNSPEKVANYFFYLLRNEIIPDKLRINLKLKPGESTYYNIVGGVGINGAWHYSPFMVCRGEYNVKTETTFSFEALKSTVTGLPEDLPAGWECTIHCPANGHFNVEMKWPNPKSSSGDQIGFSSLLQAVRPPFFAGPDGCFPCTGGAGTLYFSFTQMITNATLLTPENGSTYFSNGTGWVDRQWLNNAITDKSTKILANISGTFSAPQKGLGRYLWYNLHVSTNLQYMVSAFPTDRLKVGDTIPGVFNRYGTNTTRWGIKGTVVIKKTVDVTDPGTGAVITYPTVISFYIPRKNSPTGQDVYHLDSTRFGVNITVDLSNNIHWTGSALLYSDNNGELHERIGTGFVEANQLQDHETYNKNILSKSKIDESHAALWNPKPYSIGQTWTSFAIVGLGTILVGLLFYYGYNYAKSSLFEL